MKGSVDAAGIFPARVLDSAAGDEGVDRAVAGFPDAVAGIDAKMIDAALAEGEGQRVARAPRKFRIEGVDRFASASNGINATAFLIGIGPSGVEDNAVAGLNRTFERD